MKVRAFITVTAFLIAAVASAQQGPIYDPEDFVDPGTGKGELFISRLVAGAGQNLSDEARPLRKDVGIVHLANSFYVSRFEFDYKLTQLFGGGSAPDVFRCGCSPPVYFPTPPPADATPSAPPLGAKNSLQIGFYQVRKGSEDLRVVLRYRLLVSRQTFDTAIRSTTTGDVVERRSGHDQSVGLEADTQFSIHGHQFWGSLDYIRTVTSGTISDRTQQQFFYTNRFPGRALGPVLVRATLGVGGITGRGAGGLNLINPAFEAFWHHDATDANLHLVWSPQSVRSGLEGWHTQGQIALFVDRALFVKLFR